MNKATRAAIEKIVNTLETLGDEVENLHDDEQEKFDNAPEGLEGSERYAAIEAAADNLDTAHDNITRTTICSAASKTGTPTRTRASGGSTC